MRAIISYPPAGQRSIPCHNEATAIAYMESDASDDPWEPSTEVTQRAPLYVVEVN